MLSLQNSGKYLSKTFEKDRQRAMKNSDDSELDRLELDSSDVGGVNNPDTFNIRTSPIEPTTGDKKFDVRDRDECK